MFQNMVFGNLLSTKRFYNFLQGVTLSKGKRASFPQARYEGFRAGETLGHGNPLI